MGGRDWIRDDPPSTGTEGHWDGLGTIVLLGILVPLALLAWIAFDVVRGSTWIPSRRGGITVEAAHAPVAFFGIALTKLGAAALAFVT